MGDAWLVGIEKRAPHGYRCLWVVSPHGSLARLKAYYALFLLHRILKDRHNRAR